jgi:hypothetical protein
VQQQTADKPNSPLDLHHTQFCNRNKLYVPCGFKNLHFRFHLLKSSLSVFEFVSTNCEFLISVKSIFFFQIIMLNKLVLNLCVLVSIVFAFPDGAPADVCVKARANEPNHGKARSQAIESLPFQVVASSEHYQGGSQIQGMLRSTS